MKVLRLKAYQETTCYRKPFSNKVTETYPLPPYSTVKGMIHALLNANELIPFSLSIQGQFESQLIDYKKTYFVKKRKFAMPIVMDGLKEEQPQYDTKTMSSMPLYTHLLYNINLIIHIKAEEGILNNIYESFKVNNNFLSLGRHEDLLRIDDVSFVSLKEVEDCFLEHAIYIPESYIDDDTGGLGIPYMLNWTYKIKQGIREWEKIPVMYVNSNRYLNVYEVNKIMQDDEGYPVFWNA